MTSLRRALAAPVPRRLHLGTLALGLLLLVVTLAATVPYAWQVLRP